MITKLAGVVLLVLLAEARDEGLLGQRVIPFMKINIGSHVPYSFDVPTLWGIKFKKPETKTDKSSEEDQYSQLESMDVEEVKPETGMITPILDPSISWLAPFHHNNFEDIFKILKGIDPNPWWQRQNVCVEHKAEEISDEMDEAEQGDGFFSTSMINTKTCYQSNRKYECVENIKTKKNTRILTTKYTCCHGYYRDKTGTCERVHLVPLLDRLAKVNGTEFLKLAKDAKKVMEEENVTVFMPTDEAFARFAERMLETNQLELNADAVRKRRSTNSITSEDLISAHITKGLYDLNNDDRYTSLYKNSSLVMKEVFDVVDRKSLFLVNCAKVLSTHYATNGVVHVMGKVLEPADKSIMEVIKSRKNLSTLYLLLEKTGLAESVDGNLWTLLAPTNKAFDKFQRKYPALMQKLLRGDTCTLNLLKQHLSYEFCSIELDMGLSGIKSSIGDTLRVTRSLNKTKNNDIEHINDDEDVAFYIDKSGVVEADIIASNGIIHVINELLIPDSALPISAMMKTKNLSLFSELVDKAEITEEINNLSNVTFIVPTDKAIKNFLKNDKRSKYIEDVFSKNITDEEKEKLRSFIYHHVVPGGLKSFSLEDNMMKTPMSKDSPLRINLYSTNPLSTIYNRATVDCAWLQHFDTQQCNNILHQINRPLLDIKESIMERIKDDPNLYMLHKILVGTEIETILHERNNITFVAPTNKAFAKMSPEIYNRLLNDKKMVSKLMEPHIYEDVTCCAGLYNTFMPFGKTLRSINGEMSRIAKKKIGGTTISSCDHMGTNGVLHFTDKLPAISGKPNIDVMLYGVEF